jgi:hypothetical protein
VPLPLHFAASQMLARRCLLRCLPSRMQRNISYASSSSNKPPLVIPLTDDLGLPLTPPWSVHALINSYPSPTLSNATLTRLHDLAALVPPAEGTPEFEQLKQEMEDLVRLVEAVRVAPEHPEHGTAGEGPPDGRVWPKGRGIVVEPECAGLDGGKDKPGDGESAPSGRELMKHAQRTKAGFYLVDSARTKP